MELPYFVQVLLMCLLFLIVMIPAILVIELFELLILWILKPKTGSPEAHVPQQHKRCLPHTHSPNDREKVASSPVLYRRGQPQNPGRAPTPLSGD